MFVEFNSTCVEAGGRRRKAEVRLEVLGQESRVAAQREAEADADRQREEDWVGQQTEARSRHVCVQQLNQQESTN